VTPTPPRGSSAPEDAGTPPPPVAPAAARPVRSPGAYLPLPLWARFLLAGLVGLAGVVAMIVYVSGHNTDSPPQSNPAAAVQANREAEILVARDQAPHVARLAPGLHPAAAVTAAVRADMRRRIGSGSVPGPLQRLHCRASGPIRGMRRAFSCSALAANVTYPFVGVVDRAHGRVTYCKRDPPPVPSDDVPVSRRCRA
jgi:hypothetical protein